MKIFLTGSTGFIGSHLLTKLQSLGYTVVTDMRFLHTQKYDCVIHLASKNNIKNEFDPELIESNMILTKEIFKVPSRIIYASSCVAKYPLNPYAYSKLYAEHLGAIHGKAIGLRFHNVYGPGNNKGIIWWLMQQPDGAKITIRGPELVRDYIYVDDVVNSILGFATYEKKSGFLSLQQQLIDASICDSMVYEVGTGIGLQTMDVVNLYQKISGKTFDISVSDAGENEPESMVSDNSRKVFLDIETGIWLLNKLQ